MTHNGSHSRGECGDKIFRSEPSTPESTHEAQRATKTSFGALIWSKMSTGLPMEITSAMQGQAYLSFSRLDIDIHRKNVTIRFARRTDVMPQVSMETKYHLSAIDLLLIKRLIAETSKQNLLQFLQHEFVNVRKSYAERLIAKDAPSHYMHFQDLH
ncbi:DNA topoisomerase 6 subunit B [Dionaea muscipula]